MGAQRGADWSSRLSAQTESATSEQMSDSTSAFSSCCCPLSHDPRLAYRIHKEYYVAKDAQLSLTQSPVMPPFPQPFTSTTSHWQATNRGPTALWNHGRDAPLPSHADIVIIGAGITGSSLAYQLTRYGGAGVGKRVVVLEARDVASGASESCRGEGADSKPAGMAAILPRPRMRRLRPSSKASRMVAPALAMRTRLTSSSMSRTRLNSRRKL